VIGQTDDSQRQAIFRDAVRHAQETNPLVSQDTMTPEELFIVAGEWMVDGEREKSVDLLLYLASDPVGYPAAMAEVGHLFVDRNEHDFALHWFLKAGKHNHPDSLYNAGKLLLVHKNDTIAALSHLQRAAKLWDENDPEKGVVIKAWEDACKSIPQIRLSLDQRRDAFLHGTLARVPPDVEFMWTRVIGILVIKAGALDHKALVDSALALEELLSTDKMTFSPLQTFLMLNFMVDLAVPLAKVDKIYLPLAATYAEQLQYDPLCLHSHNESETEVGCFHTATETALLAYRALKDEESVQRVTARAVSRVTF
jgi:tetratricopeptide (TPR) repeat protein